MASAKLQVPVLGLGGNFAIAMSDTGETAGSGDIPFIAGDVGITPVLGQAGSLDLTRLRLYWTVRFDDLDLVTDTLQRYPALGPRTRLYLTHVPASLAAEASAKIGDLEGAMVAIHIRRLQQSDLANIKPTKWYICAGKALRTELLRWLQGQTVVFESFDY